MVKYAQTPASVLEAPEHKAHALKMAQQSIVLLKNENNTFHLKKTIKKIAVVGPNADNRIAVLGNYNGILLKLLPCWMALKKSWEKMWKWFMKRHKFYNDTLLAIRRYQQINISWEGKPGFKAEYFNNRN